MDLPLVRKKRKGAPKKNRPALPLQPSDLQVLQPAKGIEEDDPTIFPEPPEKQGKLAGPSENLTSHEVIEKLCQTCNQPLKKLRYWFCPNKCPLDKI